MAGASGEGLSRALVFPANATLYVVGDFDATVDEVEDMIETSFGEAAPAEGAGGRLSLERHRVRPPVKHAYGAPSYELEDIQRANDEAKVQGSDDPFMPFVAPEGKVSMFQHRTLEQRELQHFFKARNQADQAHGRFAQNHPATHHFARLAKPHAGAVRGDECGL